MVSVEYREAALAFDPLRVFAVDGLAYLTPDAFVLIKQRDKKIKKKIKN